MRIFVILTVLLHSFAAKCQTCDELFLEPSEAEFIRFWRQTVDLPPGVEKQLAIAELRRLQRGLAYRSLPSVRPSLAPTASQVFSGNQVSDLLTYDSLEHFGLKDVEITKGHRTAIWKESVPEDFLDAWVDRHGAHPIPDHLRLSYYLNVFTELTDEPRTFYLRSKQVDPFLNELKRLCSDFLISTRGPGSFKSRLNHDGLRGFQKDFSAATASLGKLIDILEPLDKNFEKSRANLLKVFDAISAKEKEVLRAPWEKRWFRIAGLQLQTSEIISNQITKRRAVYKYWQQTGETRAQLNALRARLQ